MKFVQNPGTISNKGLEDAKLNTNFCTALHQSLLMMEDGFLIYCKPIAGSDSYACLVVVHTQLQNIVFIPFHSNPVGGHLNATRTFHCICLCFYWSNMYTYITKMCHSCLGWALSTPTRKKFHEMIYNFLIEALMMVLHIAGYQARRNWGLKVHPTILLRAVERAHSQSWNQILTPMQQLTHQQL
jgi:hypothetical protein